MEALLPSVSWHDSEVQSQGHKLGPLCCFTFLILCFWFLSFIHLFLKVCPLHFMKMSV